MLSFFRFRSLRSLCKLIIADNSFVQTSSHLCGSAAAGSKNKVPKEKTRKTKLKIFSDLLGTSNLVSYKFIKQYPGLLSKTIKHIKNDIHFLEELGIERAEISKNLAIFEISNSVIKRRYYSLKEIGLKIVGLPDIINYKALLACNFATLRDQKYIIGNENPYTGLLKNYKYPIDLANLLHYSCLSYEKLPISELREKIVTNCISYYLKFSLAQSAFIYKSAKLLSDTSIDNVMVLLKYIVESIEINPEIIKQEPEVLHSSVSEIKKLKIKCQLLQLDFQKLIQNFPKILLCDADNFHEICNYLLDFGISKEQITKCPRIFSFTPDYIQDGLRTMKLWPEILVLTSDPNFLNVLMKYKKANLHMFYFRKAGFDQLTASSLIASDIHFKDYINRQADKSSNRVIVHFIASKLESSYDDVLSIVRYHPLFEQASVITVRNNLVLLNNYQFTKEQIVRGLPVIFYPTDRILKSLEQVPKLPLTQPYSEWRKSVNILQLIMYILDRDEFIYHDG